MSNLHSLFSKLISINFFLSYVAILLDFFFQILQNQLSGFSYAGKKDLENKTRKLFSICV